METLALKNDHLKGTPKNPLVSSVKRLFLWQSGKVGTKYFLRHEPEWLSLKRVVLYYPA